MGHEGGGIESISRQWTMYHFSRHYTLQSHQNLDPLIARTSTPPYRQLWSVWFEKLKDKGRSMHHMHHRWLELILSLMRKEHKRWNRTGWSNRQCGSEWTSWRAAGQWKSLKSTLHIEWMILDGMNIGLCSSLLSWW